MGIQVANATRTIPGQPIEATIQIRVGDTETYDIEFDDVHAVAGNVFNWDVVDQTALIEVSPAQTTTQDPVDGVSRIEVQITANQEGVHTIEVNDDSAGDTIVILTVEVIPAEAADTDDDDNDDGDDSDDSDDAATPVPPVSPAGAPLYSGDIHVHGGKNVTVIGVNNGGGQPRSASPSVVHSEGNGLRWLWIPGLLALGLILASVILFYTWRTASHTAQLNSLPVQSPVVIVQAAAAPVAPATATPAAPAKVAPQATTTTPCTPLLSKNHGNCGGKTP